MTRVIPVLRANPQTIADAAAWIRQGQVIAYPTETLYGLAVDALAPRALDHLLAVKKRDPVHYLPVIVADRQMLERIVSVIPPKALQLMDRFWPGPLTLVLPAAAGLGPLLVNAKGGIGVRISSDPVATALVKQVGGPITCTSANTSGSPAATTAKAAIIEGIWAVLDDGPREALASTVIEVLAEPIIVRQGAIKIEDL